MASLWRLPFVVINTISLHTISTNPNPSTPKKERAPVRAYDRFGLVKLIPITYWIIAFIEIAQILGYIWGNQSYISIDCLETAANPCPKLHLTPTSIVGTLLIVMGAYVRHQCYRTLGSMFTFKVGIQKEHKLVKHGPYSIVRHPSYTGSYIAFMGRLLWYFSRGSFLRETTSLAGRVLAVFIITMSIYTIVMVWLRIPKEDELLREQFGKEWEEWAERVPYRLVPLVY